MAHEGDIHPFNLPLYAASSLVLYAIIIPGTPRRVQYAFVPVIGLISYQLITKTTTGSVVVDAVAGCLLLIQPLMHFANTLLVDPDSLVDCTHREGAETGKITEKGWWDRVLWTLRLGLNVRGIGWKHEVRPVPGKRYPASTPRWSFVGKTGQCILLNIFLSCAGLAGIMSNPAMTTNDALASAPVHLQIIAVLSCGLAVRAGMDNVYLTAALCAVAGGFSTPDEWPEMFGSVLDAWSVGRFWSVTWHQMLRRCLTVNATLSTRLLGIYGSPPGILSLFEAIIWLWAVFFVSGFVHIGGEYMATRQLLLNGGIFKFFMLQPVAIIMERILFPHAMGAKSTVKTCPILLRVLGYCWVVLWCTWTFVPVIDVYLATGILHANPLQDLVKTRFEGISQFPLHQLQWTAASFAG